LEKRRFRQIVLILCLSSRIAPFKKDVFLPDTCGENQRFSKELPTRPRNPTVPACNAQ